MEVREDNLVAVREDILSKPLYPLDQVTLIGSKCKKCGEVMFGEAAGCGNCSSEDLEIIKLSKTGKLWTYTVICNCPPGQYRGPKDPFVPFVEGLVELPDGVRVLSVIDCDVNEVEIGMDLVLDIFPLYVNDEGKTVISFRFKKA